MDLLDHLRASARANRLANLRLARAMAPLSDAEFHAARMGFFPSLAKTLNHILAVDTYCIAGLCGEADMRARIDGFVDAATLAEWAQRQAASDERLIALCDALDAADVRYRRVEMAALGWSEAQLVGAEAQQQQQP